VFGAVQVRVSGTIGQRCIGAKTAPQHGMIVVPRYLVKALLFSLRMPLDKEEKRCKIYLYYSII
jgi:hypothetical protein